MSKLNYIPVIDLFAGPGGLGEGFSSITYNRRKIFKIKISIEKDKYAHETLELRSFYRKFKDGNAPKEYYDVLTAVNNKKRKKIKTSLFEKYLSEYKLVKNEALCLELGLNKKTTKLIDNKIKKSIKGINNWVLIGGPPCQAYSLVGRSRVGGIKKDDNRVFLYKEYLRVIAKHQPSIFVMENVKGLLSAKVNDESIFNLVKRDLSNPKRVYTRSKSKRYKLYSLVCPPNEFTKNGFPVYNKNSDFTIKSEDYGIPQKRHRVIILGIREDIEKTSSILIPLEKKIKLKTVLNDLPKIRSSLNRSYISSDIIEGKKKRYYEKVIDTDENWLAITSSFRKEIASWDGFVNKGSNNTYLVSKNGIGSEFVKCNTPYKNNPHFDWYNDPKLNGVCNHVSRSHLIQDLKRYLFASIFANSNNRFPRLNDYEKYSNDLLPDHKSAKTGKFADRFRVQLSNEPATTVTSHISKDGHYFIHYDPKQCRSLTVREAARIQTFPDNYLFCGPRTAQYHQVGNAVPPYLAKQIAEIVLNILIH